MRTYEIASYITLFSFFSTLLVNSLLIYLTIFRIKLIHGPYKWMIVIFAFIGILFSFEEVIVRPCIHNFNGAFMFFSLNDYLPKWILFYVAACYGGFVSNLLAFVAMQFLFRYWTLSNSRMIKTFRGIRVLFWVVFIMTPSVLYATFTILLVSPDEFSDSYMEQEIWEVYNLKLTEVTRFIILAYENDSIRWRNSFYVVTTCAIFSTSFLIITYCALRMRQEMKTCLEKMSEKNSRLETQFFKALICQIAFPTFLLVLPIGPVVLLPFLDLQVSLQTGFMFSLFSLYPPMDSIAMMMIITEYKKHIGHLWFQIRHPCSDLPAAETLNSTQMTTVSSVSVETINPAPERTSNRAVTTV